MSLPYDSAGARVRVRVFVCSTSQLGHGELSLPDLSVYLSMHLSIHSSPCSARLYFLKSSFMQNDRQVDREIDGNVIDPKGNDSITVMVKKKITFTGKL